MHISEGCFLGGDRVYKITGFYAFLNVDASRKKDFFAQKPAASTAWSHSRADFLQTRPGLKTCRLGR